jgi:type I restriction enzyme S subunit
MMAQGRTIGDLIEPRREKAVPSQHPNLSYVGLEHIESHSTRLVGSVPATQMRSTAKRFYSGDVLYSRLRPYLNKVWRADRDGLCSSEFIVMPGNDEIDSNFLRYRLNSSDFVRFANSLNAGDRPRVDFDQISSFILPNFSLAVQRTAVAEIEKQFTRLEAGVAALWRVQANLKRYRAAVLKAACEGRLVPTEAELAKAENRKFETGEELLARILYVRRQRWQGRGKYKEPAAPDTTNLAPLPEEWKWASVEQLGDVQLGRQRSPKNVSKNYPTKYIRAANITERGLNLSDILEMEFSPAERERFALRDGDIVLSEASGSPAQVGKPAVWREEIPLCCFQNTVLRLRPAVVGSKFVVVAFQHCYVNGVFAKVAGGVGNHLGAEKFSAIPFPLPPLAEQMRIVAEVERRLSILREIDAMVRANLNRATRLRQAILQQAFWT